MKIINLQLLCTIRFKIPPKHNQKICFWCCNLATRTTCNLSFLKEKETEKS